MKRTLLFLLPFTMLAYACRSSGANGHATTAEDTVAIGSTAADSSAPQLTAARDTSLADTVAAEDLPYADYYIVVADTGFSYQPLQAKLLQLKAATHLEADSMGRYYNPQKNRIVLPDDDEDEIYAGEYYPRREPGEYLSLEYLYVYSRRTEDSTLALVTGIYNDEAAAKAALPAIKAQVPGAFVMKGSVYIGCMH